MSTGDFMFDLPKHRSSAIKVIGVGGGGSNAVNHMFQQGITGVDFVVCNTDAQALNNSPVPNRVQLGISTTEGLGAGANPEVGEQAALESMEDIKKFLDNNTKMVFITAGMGGGTGTGAAPIIAGISKEMGILTVGIVTAPFYFEGKMRLEQAEQGIEKLRKNVDSLIVINNDKLRELYGNLSYKEAFMRADEVLTTAAKGIAEVITKHYMANIDLKDARTVLADSGTAIMGNGKASGENKAKEAIMSALDSPLLNNNKITGAQNVLLLIVSGENEVTMDEIGIINDYIQNEAGNNANIIMGIGEDLDLGDKISVTIVATGFPAEDQVFTGREEEKIVHRLEEEQTIVQKLSTETPFPVHVKKVVDEIDEPILQVEKAPISETKNESLSNHEIKHYLDLEEDEPKFETKEEESWEIKIKTEENPKENTSQEFDFEMKEEAAEVEKKINVSEPVLFTLDDDFEDEVAEETTLTAQTVAQTQPEVKQEIKIEEEVNPFDMPISGALSKAIEERRARLKQFNYKFKNTLNNKSIDEVENIPAYKRQGIELAERENNSPSDFMITKDNNNETKIRPNNFLHDNVD